MDNILRPHALVNCRLDDGVLVIEIDNPPVNAGSLKVRDGIIQALSSSPRGKGAIIVGAGKTFIAGSDLKEFGQTLMKPELPDVIAAIELAPFPVVAAIHGVALGGGLELALGCDAIVASRDAILGLPEVSLGMVPGAGGTQRLPRRVGVARAIEMVCTSERVSAQKCLEDGLIDAIADEDLLVAAKTYLQRLAGEKRPIINCTVPLDPEGRIEAAEDMAIKRSRGRTNIREAIRLIKSSATEPPKAALTDERAVFQTLRTGEEALALRHLFFAERKASNIVGVDPKSARQVDRVGIVGGGTMGQGIARAFLASGFTVVLVERDANVLEKSINAMQNDFSEKVQRRRISADEAEDRLARLNPGAVSDLSACDFVIEAIFEDMAAKKALLEELARLLLPETIIATNTSYLDIDELSSVLDRPERLIGLHFFSPADVMPLLEIVRTSTSEKATIATALRIARRLSKQPVVARVAEGFIGNRIFAAYRRQAELLVLDGASPEAVDEAVRGFGFAMGPFEVADLSGLDIAWAMRKRKAANRDARERYVAVPDRLCEAGRLGRKTGGGWYDYVDGKPRHAPAVAEIIQAERRAAGIGPRDFSQADIQNRLMAAIVNEAACLLEDGIAEHASDIDVALANGYGFPRWKGGPMFWASRQEASSIEAAQRELADANGPTHRRGDVTQAISRAIEG